jgi:hypothetical protein
MMILPPNTKLRKNVRKNKVIFSAIEGIRNKGRDAEFMFYGCNFFSLEECSSWISFSTSTGFFEINQNASSLYAKRIQGRIQIESSQVASDIFNRLQPGLPQLIDSVSPVGCISNIRIYRYTVGQSFGKHIDESGKDPENRGVTKLTVLIYLNGHDECELDSNGTSMRGGETVFYSDEKQLKKRKNVTEDNLYAVIKPEMGKIFIHAHGDRCLEHEGLVVTQGTKYVLRTDVVYG